jgi:hypothetical protein
MSNRRWLTVLVFLVLFGVSVIFAHPSAEAGQNFSGQTQAYKSPWQKIDDQARLENPSDGNSVRALIDEILDFPSSFGRIPPIMREIIEQRLVDAEINYKLGRTQGIEEKSVVQIVNTLADKLRLSDSARTTLHQVEVLRFSMELSSPDFMPPPTSQDESAALSLSKTDLSPAQAAHILLVLIDQKILNPDYQLPPEEWEKTQYQTAMDRMLKYKELRDSGQMKTTVTASFRASSPSSRDLRSQIYDAVSKMSLTEGLDLVNEAFGIAGISK